MSGHLLFLLALKVDIWEEVCRSNTRLQIRRRQFLQILDIVSCGGLQQDSQWDLISATASTVAGPYFYTPPMHGGRSLSSFVVQLSGVQGVL